MVIDFEMNLPTKETYAGDIQQLLSIERKGQANYANIFGPGYLRRIGMTPEDLEQAQRDMPTEKVEEMLTEKMMALVMSMDDFVKVLDDAGVSYGILGTSPETPSNDHTGELVKQYPNKFIGFVRVNPHDIMGAVRELERSVKELGLKGLALSPYVNQLRANEKKFYPLYAKCVELGIPVRIYSSMNYATDRPMDLGRPIFLDEVAIDFPELTIIAGLGGWPWVPEMIGLARRHPKVYIDTAAHRPRYFNVPGAGWEMLLQFGNTLLQDKIIFAASWMTVGIPIKQCIEEIRQLPLKEEVKEKWLYKNAATVLGLE